MSRSFRSVLAGLVGASIVLVVGVSGCTARSASPEGSRNFYESLDLSSPVAAVETFSDAFARDDFMTVWLALDLGAQKRLETDFNLLQWGLLIDVDAVPDIHAEIQAAYSFENIDSDEMWYNFDRAMMIADRNDAYLVDLSGTVVPGDESVVPGAGSVVVEVPAVVEGIEGEVRFRLVQSPSGRWRVYQVIVPGGDEALVPWSVPQS